MLVNLGRSKPEQVYTFGPKSKFASDKYIGDFK